MSIMSLDSGTGRFMPLPWQDIEIVEGPSGAKIPDGDDAQGFRSAAAGRYGDFDIAITYASPVNSYIRNTFADAEAFWESAITGYRTAALGSSPDLSSLDISVSIEEIDGPNGILGRAGATRAIEADGYTIPVEGEMLIDSADIRDVVTEGGFFDLVLHELAHIIGFSNYYWVRNGATHGMNDTTYTGAHALSTYQREFDPAATFVPIEDKYGDGSAFNHWDLALFGNSGGNQDNAELMTAFQSSSMYVSDTTIASFADLGYTVDLDTGVHNEPPNAIDDTIYALMGGPVTIDVLANDCDAEGDALHVTRIVDVFGGRATINPDDTITFIPDKGVAGMPGFVYEISDGAATDVAIAAAFVAGDLTPAQTDVFPADHVYINTDWTISLTGALNMNGALAIVVYDPDASDDTFVGDSNGDPLSDGPITIIRASDLEAGEVYLCGALNAAEDVLFGSRFIMGQGLTRPFDRVTITTYDTSGADTAGFAAAGAVPEQDIMEALAKSVDYARLTYGDTLAVFDTPVDDAPVVSDLFVA